MNKERYNELAAQVVDACFQVHRELGPGLLESAYEYALLKEFELRNIRVQNQVPVKLKDLILENITLLTCWLKMKL